MALLTTGALAESRRVVTVRELFEPDHRLTIEPATEVVWGDPPYRGRFTVVAGHGTAGEVYSVTVTVKNP